MKLKTIKQRLAEGQALNKAVTNTITSMEQREYRLLKRVKTILEHEHTYFITWTLSNKYIDLKQQTHLRKIKEALGSASTWITNIDFGKRNSRLHYHSLVGLGSQLDYSTIQELYQYGNVDILPVYDTNAQALKNYISKLKEHAIKKTATEIYYSRRKRNEICN